MNTLFSEISEELTKDDLDFYMFMIYGKIPSLKLSSGPNKKKWKILVAALAFISIFFLIMILLFLFLAIIL